MGTVREVEESEIRETLQELFYRPTSQIRRVKMFTNAGGMDMFEEAMENNVGLKRVYIGHKVPRILRRLRGKIIKSYTKGYYKRLPLSM